MARSPRTRLADRPGLTLVQGDPMGPMHEVMAETVAQAVVAGTPSIVVLTDETAPQYRNRLRDGGLDVEAAEQAGMLWYVDACAPSVGWAHTSPNTVFAERDGADGILMALSELQAGVVERAPDHLVVVDSMSTFIVLEGPREGFLIARTLRSFGDRLGASVVLSLTRGMHPEEAIVPLVHLADVVLELDREGKISGTPKADQRDRE